MSPIFEIRTKYVHIRTTWFTDAITPTKSAHNAWAGQDNPDAENSECQYNADEPQRKHKKKRVSLVASAGGTDGDLAAPQFLRNWGAYNIIAF